MPDPYEPFGRDMHQEPAYEFFTGDGDFFPLSLVFVVFCSKGNSAVCHAFNTVVADRDPVGILDSSVFRYNYLSGGALAS